MPSTQWSRVNQTDPSPYDQIFILSQDLINKSFHDAYGKGEKFQRYDKEAVRTGTADPLNMTGQWIDNTTIVGPPRISINVEERNPAYPIWFTLPFIQGTIHLSGSPPGTPSNTNPVERSLQGWELVFKTRINTKDIAGNDPKYKDYKSPPGARAPGFRDTVFGLKRLYLDTSGKLPPYVGAGGGLDLTRSLLKGAPLPPDALYNLKLFANEWLATFDDKGLNVIGHSLTRDDSTPQQRSKAGTFLPSLIDYAPYPWLDPDNNTVVTNDLGSNALGILTYTGIARRDKLPPPGLAYSGVFTDGGAAFCMNRSLFWEHYLLPILREINQKTEVIPQKAPNLQGTIRYVLGRNPKHPQASDGYFNWKERSQNGQVHWFWHGLPQKNVTSFGQPPQAAAYRYGQEARSSTQVSFTAGGREIHLKGTVIYDIHLVSIGNPWNASDHTEAEWDLPLRIDAVRGGGLQIVAARTPTVRVNANRSRSHGWKGNKQVEKFHQTVLTKSLDGLVRKITNQLAQDLVDLHKLFLPGRGVFRFGAALLNKRGDLLAPLEYISTRNSNAVHKVVVDPASETEADALPFEEDLDARFSHIPHFSEEYPEDAPVFDHPVDPDAEQEEWSHHFVDIHDVDPHQHADHSDASFVGPGPGPLAHVDLDVIKGDDQHDDPIEKPPPKPNKGGYVAPVFGITDG